MNAADLQKDHKRWLAELTLELRLLDVDGHRIGDAVATAREFLDDAHVPAQEAFGTPRDYAAELGLAPPPERQRDLRRTVMYAALDVLGFLAFAFTGGAAWRGDEFDLDAGTAVLVVSVLVLVLLTPRLFSPVLRAAPWKIFAGTVALLAGQVAVLLALGDVELLSLPAWPVATLGLLVLVTSLVRAWVTRDDLDDPVVEPLEGPVDDRTGRLSRVAAVLPQVVSFVAAWAFVLMDVLAG